MENSRIEQIIKKEVPEFIAGIDTGNLCKKPAECKFADKKRKAAQIQVLPTSGTPDPAIGSPQDGSSFSSPFV